MNTYEVTYRNKGRALELYRRSVLAESLQAAIDLVNKEMPMESHEEYVSVAETARNVLLLLVKQRRKGKG